MGVSPIKAVIPEDIGGKRMGANSTQAVAIVFLLIAFILLAGAMAGGGILLALAGLVLLGVAGFFFLKAKPWEYQND